MRGVVAQAETEGLSVDKDDAAVIKLIHEIVKIISQDHLLALVATLGLLYLFAQAVAAPVVAWYTARRQRKVDKGQAKLSEKVDSGQSSIIEKLERLDRTINGDPGNGKPAAVERVIEGQARILDRLEHIEHVQAEQAQDIRALREGQRDTLTEVRSQLAFHSEAVERLVQLRRHEANERRKAKRNF